MSFCLQTKIPTRRGLIGLIEETDHFDEDYSKGPVRDSDNRPMLSLTVKDLSIDIMQEIRSVKENKTGFHWVINLKKRFRRNS